MHSRFAAYIPMKLKFDIHNIINIASIVVLGVFSFYDESLLGLGISLLMLGVNGIMGFIWNADPIFFSISGFDHAMKLLFKEYNNRFSNLTWGILLITVGAMTIYSLLK